LKRRCSRCPRFVRVTVRCFGRLLGETKTAGTKNCSLRFDGPSHDRSDDYFKKSPVANPGPPSARFLLPRRDRWKTDHLHLPQRRRTRRGWNFRHEHDGESRERCGGQIGAAYVAVRGVTGSSIYVDVRLLGGGEAPNRRRSDHFQCVWKFCRPMSGS